SHDGPVGMRALLHELRGGHPRAAAARAGQSPARGTRLSAADGRGPRARRGDRGIARAAAPRERERAIRARGRSARQDSGDGMTVDLSLLPDGGVGWLDASGQHSDIVLSTRIRLARNVEGYAFTGRARDGERLRVLSQVREAVTSIPAMSDSVMYRLDELPSTARSLLHERHLVSKELAGLEPPHPLRTRAAVFLADGLGVMVNEEDHLRLQALRSGFALQEAYAAIDKLDRELGSRVPYSYHGEFGFLTACPTNVGTGLRGSVLIHLPGLVLTK